MTEIDQNAMVQTIRNITGSEEKDIRLAFENPQTTAIDTLTRNKLTEFIDIYKSAYAHAVNTKQSQDFAKWRVFGLYQTISSHAENISDEELVAEMLVTDDDELVALFDKHEVVVWEPLENWTCREIVDNIDIVATAAYNTANEITAQDTHIAELRPPSPRG